MSKPRPGQADSRPAVPAGTLASCGLLPGHRGETLSASAGIAAWLPQDMPHGFINQSRVEVLRVIRACATVESTWTTAGLGESGPLVTKHEMG